MPGSGLAVDYSQRGVSDERMTAKQRAFVQEYMLDRNVSAAARRAGYKTPSIGNKLMKHPLVRAEIGKREQEAYEQSNISVAEIVGRLAEVLRFDVLDLCDENGQIALDDLTNMPKAARSTIKELDVKSTTGPDGEERLSAKIKFYSKLEAADMLMRYFGAYKPEVLQQLVQLDWDKMQERSDPDEDDPFAEELKRLTDSSKAS